MLGVCILVRNIVASAGGELTIDAFPPVHVLWMCCRAGAMDMIFGVVDSSIVETKQIIY